MNHKPSSESPVSRKVLDDTAYVGRRENCPNAVCVNGIVPHWVRVAWMDGSSGRDQINVGAPCPTCHGLGQVDVYTEVQTCETTCTNSP